MTDIIVSYSIYTDYGSVPLFSVSSPAGICWLYAGKLCGRCGEWEGDGAGGLSGTAEKVLARGGGAGTCRNVERRE